MLIKRRQVEYWKSQFTDYNLKGVDNTSRSLFSKSNTDRNPGLVRVSTNVNIQFAVNCEHLWIRWPRQ